MLLTQFGCISQEISDLCYEVDVRPAEARLIVGATDALTRKRSDNYYESINDVFNNADRQVAYIAAMVKMADRMHNILTIITMRQLTKFTSVTRTYPS